MAKKMIVDQDICIGCGACVGVCPESFEINEEGKSVFIGKGDEACDADSVINSCPVGAIRAEE